MNILLFILFCLYVGWTALITICVVAHIISKFVLKQELAPLTWNWLPKTAWAICTITVILYFWW